jgi:hypothetical protein
MEESRIEAHRATGCDALQTKWWALNGTRPALRVACPIAKDDVLKVIAVGAAALLLVVQPARATAQARLIVDGQSSDVSATNLSQLLSGRFAGVEVAPGGGTGMGSRVRIRGQSSLLLGNDPLLVVDGTRLTPTTNTATTQVPSRFDDIDIGDIATIEIIKGPAGSLRYGTGAANGVVVITTRQGLRGRPKLEVHTENGVVGDPTAYPDLYLLWGKRGANTTSGPCTLSPVSTGTCVVDSLSRGSVLKTDSLTPIDVGIRSRYGARVSGGSKRVQYSFSGSAERETGVYRMPARDQRALENERAASAIPDVQVRPNALAKNNVQAKLSLHPNSKLDINLSGLYLGGNTRFVPNDGRADGLLYNATGGTWRLDRRDPTSKPLVGYAAYRAGDVMSESNSRDIHRLTNNASANLRPVRWLDLHGAFGTDDVTERDKFLIMRDQGPPLATREGFVKEGGVFLYARTADASATAQRALASWLTTTTTIGAQWLGGHDSSNVRTGSGLAVGATSAGSANQQSTSFGTADSRSSAYYAEEVLGIHNTLFVTGGVRHDIATINAFQWTTDYPSAGVSWLALSSQNRAMGGTLDTVRLRANYGTSGVLPQTSAGIPNVLAGGTITNSVGTVVAAPSRPEYSAEAEGGVDMAAFRNASRIGVTYYQKTTREGWYAQPLASPIGSPAAGLYSGLRVQNTGVELTLSQRLVTTRSFSASIDVLASGNRNRILSFPPTLAPVFTGDRSTQTTLPGYPLFGLWSRSYTYNDANADGLLTLSELTISDAAQYIGPSVPTRELVLAPSVSFFNRALRVTAQIDSKSGYYKFNNTLRHQCANAASCRGLNDRTADLATQAAALAAVQGTFSGVIEDASFTRFRELTVGYRLPSRWMKSLGAREGSVVATGRNLGVRTKYTGTDPETTSSTTDARGDEFFSAPPVRYWLLRLNLVF